MEPKRRIYYLDFLRCLACLMVVLQHAPVPGGGLSGMVVVPISLASGAVYCAWPFEILCMASGT